MESMGSNGVCFGSRKDKRCHNRWAGIGGEKCSIKRSRRKQVINLEVGKGICDDRLAGNREGEEGCEVM